MGSKILQNSNVNLNEQQSSTGLTPTKHMQNQPNNQYCQSRIMENSGVLKSAML